MDVRFVDKIARLKQGWIAAIFAVFTGFFLILFNSSVPFLPWFLGFVDLLKGISWPLALGLIAYMFKGEIGNLLDRVREAGPRGAKFDPKQPEQQQKQKQLASEIERNRQHPEIMLEKKAGEAEGTSVIAAGMSADPILPSVVGGSPGKPTDPSDIKLKDLPGMSRTLEQASLERVLHFVLRTKDEIPEDLRVDFLIRLLAEAQISLEFEKIYRIIYGSQLRGLRRLRELQTISVGDARQYFHSVVSENADFYTDSSFEPWLDFLIRAGLIIKFGPHLNSDAAQLKVTSFGDDFLHYIFERRYTDQLPH